MSKAVLKLKQLYNEFNAESSIFACRFLANRNASKFEKVWWNVWIVAAFLSCWYSVLITLRIWMENPVVIVYAPHFMPVSTIPFPAITICPLTKARVEAFNLSAAFEVIKNGSSLDEHSEKQLQVMAHVCPFSYLWKNFSANPEEFVFQTLKYLTPPFEKAMNMCKWRNEYKPCKHLFTESLVDDGICYTFNKLLANETYRVDTISKDFTSFATWAVPSSWAESKYAKQAGLNAYPHRALASGIKSGLFFIPELRKVDQDFLCRGPYTGYKFAVHAPGETPLTGDKFFRLTTLNAVTLMVTPKVIRTGKHLRSISPSKRNCFFDDEPYLRFFRSYSVYNCILECISNYTFSKCHCVKFSMPRSADMKVCDASQIGCYNQVYQDLYHQTVSNLMAGKLEGICYCLPSCNSIHYNVEISQIPFNFHELAMALGLPTKYEGVDPAVMIVGFKERHYLPKWRREMIDINDALAKVAGIFTLLVGASMLSFGEILFFCCIRPLRRERVRARRGIRDGTGQQWVSLNNYLRVMNGRNKGKLFYYT